MKTNLRKASIFVSTLLFLALMAGLAMPLSDAQASGTTILVDKLQPTWGVAGDGGGGVYAAYYWPDSITSPGVSPGSTAVYDGREAGIIKAGITPSGGHYTDEGLLAFKLDPSVPLSTFAAQALSYVVENQTGANPVWVRIRLTDTNQTEYQFVPTTNPASWHTVDAATGQWQLMDVNGNATGPLMSLAAVASANPGLSVDRIYLTLGIGDSYNVSPGVGTVGWVDKVTIGTVTYDFVVPSYWYVATTGSDTNEGTMASPFLTISHAITAAAPGETIHVTAGNYPERLTINKPLTLSGAGVGLSIIDATSFLTAGNVIDITGLTGNTKIEGFDIKTGDMSNGIHFAGGTDAGGKIEILNNHIISTDNYADGVDQFGIIGGYGDVRHLIISGNEISNTGSNGILAERQMGATDITGNTLNGAFPTIWFMTYNGNNVTPLQKVSGNTIDMSTADAGTNAAGITFYPSYAPGVTSLGRYANVEISGNTITGLGDASFKGISVREASLDCSGGFDILKIFNNTISGTNGIGIQLTGHVAGADIHNNTITGLLDGIKAWSYLTTCLPDGNNIYHNQIGLASDKLVYWTGTSTFNVENNWWGAAAGPDPAKMSANVDYTPWCTNQACTSEQPPLPSSFWGYIHFQTGDNPPTSSSVLTAWIPGVTGAAASVTLTNPAQYAFNVPGDLAGTSVKEGGVENDVITFKIGDRIVGTGVWHGGTNVQLDLHPPQAVPGGPYYGLVGASISLNGSANDWGPAPTNYAWDLDNNGSYETSGQNITHVWTTVGTYTIGLQVTDSQGGVGTATTTVYVQTTCNVNNLVTGWNLVSLCLSPLNTAPGTVLNSLSGSYDLVYGWDGSVASNNWLKFAPGGPGYANNMTRLDEKMGFWVHMTAPGSLTVTGYPPVTTSIPLSTVGGGWNLVGYPSLTPMSLPGTLHDFSLIYAYHANDASVPFDPWKLFDVSAPQSWVSDLQSLTSTWGYWIKVTSSYIWTVTY